MSSGPELYHSFFPQEIKSFASLPCLPSCQCTPFSFDKRCEFNCWRIAIPSPTPCRGPCIMISWSLFASLCCTTVQRWRASHTMSGSCSNCSTAQAFARGLPGSAVRALHPGRACPDRGATHVEPKLVLGCFSLTL